MSRSPVLIRPPADSGTTRQPASRPPLVLAGHVAVAAVIAAHGLVHLMGVALLWKLGEPGELTYADAVPEPGTAGGHLVGAWWLLAAVLLFAAGVMLACGRARWRGVALAGVVLSMAVIALNPGQAVAGLAANALVVAAVVVSRLGVWRGGAS